MEIFPAIDISGGKAVRLTQGRYDDMRVYNDDPVRTAEGFLSAGAKNLHVVDLDGAKAGRAVHFPLIRELVGTCGLFVQIGGGIRDEAQVADYLEAGADRIILGTVAVKNFAFVEDMVKKYGEHIAVGVDARGGRAAVGGWLEDTETDAYAFCKRLMEAGVSTVIYTDIERDGALIGANMAAYAALTALSPLNVIASGGVSHEKEITALKNMGVYGAIVGKALYEKRLDLGRLLALACGTPGGVTLQ